MELILRDSEVLNNRIPFVQQGSPKTSSAFEPRLGPPLLGGPVRPEGVISDIVTVLWTSGAVMSSCRYS